MQDGGCAWTVSKESLQGPVDFQLILRARHSQTSCRTINIQYIIQAIAYHPSGICDCLDQG